ncbi:hypothetical protein WISP_79172 [Willisornis vidua]|uniref:Uncharacterized protein n=1 Tax=Willisornis vidua TaxID=1566151 RepID=A0ABQ9D559_9PASS|nr:hypothetical protein WISP_79172 [Willisornis vidua]
MPKITTSSLEKQKWKKPTKANAEELTQMRPQHQIAIIYSFNFDLFLPNRAIVSENLRIQAGNKMLVCSSEFDMLELRILRGGNKAQSKVITLDFRRPKSLDLEESQRKHPWREEGSSRAD